MKYKVGDRVKVIRAEVLSDRPYVGKIGTITEINADSMYPYKVRFDEDINDNKIYSYGYSKDALELVKDTPIFKVGDRVIVTQCHNGFGTIKTDLNQFSLYIQMDNGEICIQRAEKLELIETPERKEEKAEEKVNGGWISVDESSFSGGIEFEPGSLWFGDGVGQLWQYDTPKPKKFMATLKTIASKLLDADIKALVKAGWLDEELELTEEGQEAVLAYVLLENKVELAKEARKQIKANKKDEE